MHSAGSTSPQAPLYTLSRPTASCSAPFLRRTALSRPHSPERTRERCMPWSASSTRRVCSTRTSIQSRCRRRGTRDARSRTLLARLLSARALQPLVIVFALEAELVDQLRVGLEGLRQVDSERPRVDLGIVDRQLDLEGAEVRAAELFGHLP